MEIFYNPQSNLSLDRYGIKIPLTDRRVERVLLGIQDMGFPLRSLLDKTYPPNSLRSLMSRVHHRDYVDRVFGSRPEVESTLVTTFELLDEEGRPNRYYPDDRSLPLHGLQVPIFKQVEGTILAAEAALSLGSTFFLGGGFHHAMSFGGRGFCYVNDIVMAAKHLQDQGVDRIWIVDIDAHKGDGTAELCKSDPSIKTLSIHMKSGWPLDSDVFDDKHERYPWFIPSDVDIPIDVGEESQYLSQLSIGLEKLKDSGVPDFVFVVQGSDPYEKDQLPSSGDLQLSLDQILQRDILVHDFVEALGVPHCHVMSGGYGDFAHIPFVEYFQQIKPRR